MARANITVILPTFDGAEFLDDALTSIRAQTLAPREILVVDDGSTDDTRAIVAQHAAQCFALPHRGRPAFGRNVGIRAARGEFIAFLDQDDMWTNDALEKQFAAFCAQPHWQVVLGRAQKIIRAQGSWTADGAPLTQPFLSAALFRRAVFARVGLLDETLEFFGDDTDWFARARELQIPIKMLDAVTLQWRIHARNASHQNWRAHAHGIDRPLLEVVKKALERQRAHTSR
jgi:glycosyltransferase involved in cell wall biosynthesis